MQHGNLSEKYEKDGVPAQLQGHFYFFILKRLLYYHSVPHVQNQRRSDRERWRRTVIKIFFLPLKRKEKQGMRVSPAEPGVICQRKMSV